MKNNRRKMRKIVSACVLATTNMNSFTQGFPTLSHGPAIQQIQCSSIKLAARTTAGGVWRTQQRHRLAAIQAPPCRMTSVTGVHMGHETNQTSIAEKESSPSSASGLLLVPAFSSSASSSSSSSKPAFDAAVLFRHACKKFQRFDGSDRCNVTTGKATASQSDPLVVQQAIQALELARLSPSAYNSQPYKFVVVHSPAQKEAIAKFALGPNGNRVLDSDVTVVFLADRQVLRTLPLFRASNRRQPANKPQNASKWAFRKLQLYLALFSSGYPLPRVLSSILSFFIRSGVAAVHLLTRSFYPMPTLSSAETWASKQALMVAMTYMLACASRGLDTIPMEGIHGGGIRRALGVPSRYAVPLIVSTGRKYVDPARNVDETTTVASSGERAAVRQRYPMKDMIFSNQFGAPLQDSTMAGATLAIAAS
jgi:nitroreductase